MIVIAEPVFAMASKDSTNRGDDATQRAWRRGISVVFKGEIGHNAEAIKPALDAIGR